MSDYQDLTTKYFVAKASKRNENVEYISISEFNGLFNSNSEMEGNSYNEPRKANAVIAHMNALYEEFGLGYYCYLVRTTENNTHVISSMPEDFRAVVDNFLGIEDETVIEEPTV